MNREERGVIRQLVLNSRRLLEEEFEQLLRLYGLLPENSLPLEKIPAKRREKREKLDRVLEREGLPYPEARRRWVRHAAFTFLNRLLALRVAEVHGLIRETVVTRPEYGNRSLRERDLADFYPELAADPQKLSYRALEEACAELAVPLLFQTEGDPYSLLKPRLPANRRVREEIARVPEAVWREFESLGWAYQYFNDEVRREIRAQLRRNPEPDHIPPINQFYTVGWIVKFLVHNTLGRLWLENHPGSGLGERLDYLVPVRNALPPPREPVKVEELKVLDPACGSGHFLLGAFDLLLDMWQDEHPEIPKWQIPTLILENNLFGVDIDLRACQIAAIALWLKARTTFEKLKDDDPDACFEPKRVNIVCADIRFTDGQRRLRFLQEFTEADVRRIAEETLRACEKSFEIGSLLRIRQPFEDLFAQRTARLEDLQKNETWVQLRLFSPQERQLAIGDIPVPVPKPLTVEEIVKAIRQFVREASEVNDMGSMLFGMAAEQAVHLVDVLTECYDVVLMNPPYGAMPAACKEYAREHYPHTHSDYYAAFIEQAVNLTKPGGYIGALTGRTFLFLKSFQRLREEILRHDALPEVVLDLGFNVLDGATARWAAFTLRKRWPGDDVMWQDHPVAFFRLTSWQWEEKRVKFEEALAGMTASGNVSQTMERV